MVMVRMGLKSLELILKNDFRIEKETISSKDTYILDKDDTQ